MKRFICILAGIVLTISLSACGAGENSSVSSSESSRLTLSTGATVSVKDYALKGEIYNCEFKIGTSIQEIKDAYHYGDDEYWGNAASDTQSASSDIKHNIDATPLEILGEDPIRMITGDAKYYYHPAKEQEGIAYVAYFGDAYGFRIGISEVNDIKNTLDDTAVYDNFAEEDDLFFFFGQPEGIYKLEYSVEDEFTLAFFFENGKLAATTLYKDDLWIVG